MSPGDGDAVALQLSALPSKDATSRCQTLLELANHDGPLPQLWPFLDDPDATVRVAAAHALWQTGTGRDALDSLVEVLRAALASAAPSEGLDIPESDDAALMAGSVLQQMGPAAVAPLCRGFRADAPEARPTIWALADLGTDEAVDFLRRVAAGPTCATAEEASRALADLNEESLPGVHHRDDISG